MHLFPCLSWEANVTVVSEALHSQPLLSAWCEHDRYEPCAVNSWAGKLEAEVEDTSHIPKTTGTAFLMAEGQVLLQTYLMLSLVTFKLLSKRKITSWSKRYPTKLKRYVVPLETPFHINGPNIMAASVHFWKPNERSLLVAYNFFMNSCWKYKHGNINPWASFFQINSTKHLLSYISASLHISHTVLHWGTACEHPQKYDYHFNRPLLEIYKSSLVSIRIRYFHWEALQECHMKCHSTVNKNFKELWLGLLLCF